MQLFKRKMRIIPIVLSLCVLASGQAWGQESPSTTETGKEYGVEIEDTASVDQFESNNVDSESDESEDSTNNVKNNEGDTGDHSVLIKEEIPNEEALLDENQDISDLAQDSADQSAEDKKEIVIQGQTDENVSYAELYSGVTSAEDAGFSGFKKDGNSWVYYDQGKLWRGAASVVRGNINGTEGWWYIDKNGKINLKYTGFAENKNGWWYVVNGIVDFTKNDVVHGTVNGENGWYHIVQNKMTPGPTVAHNKNGWWYIDQSGKVDFTYTGFAENKNGWWYCKDGKVDFTVTGFIKDTIDGTAAWWYVEENKVDFSVTDIVYGTVNGKAAWWYVKGNKLTKGPTVANNSNGWYYINSEGYVDFTYDGFAKNHNGWWLCENGKVDFSVDNCMIRGTLNGIDASWYVDNNKIIVPAVIKTDEGWVYVDKNYKIDKSFSGYAPNKNGWWYCKHGEVDFSVTSVIQGTVDGKTAWWYVKENKVTKGPTVAHNSSGWWYINKTGYVDFSYDGFAENKNGWWLVRDGKVSFGLTGAYWGTVNGVYGRWNVIENKVIIASKGTVIKIPDGLGKTYTLTYYSDKGFVFVPSMRTSIAKGSNQERVWRAWKVFGAKYNNGLATIDGAYLVAVTSTFGEVGDLLEITFRSGETMLAVIADEKSQAYVAWDHNPANVYGHNNGANVVEFEVDPAYYKKYGVVSPTKWNSMLKNSGGVAQIENLGHKY